MSSKTGTYRVGTSGYQYDHWKGVFYPDELRKAAWFGYYAERFDTVEINNTFYNLPKAETFDSWREESPTGFCYALKYSNYGTHRKRLKDPDTHVGRFVERAEYLGERLGPILVQLPPRWKADPERLDSFLKETPGRLRWAIELRDSRWFQSEVYAVLRAHKAALCVHDMIDEHPFEITADWVYWRFHGRGDEGKYTGDYPHQALSAVADRIAGLLREGIDVYAYFNNDAEGHAVRNALDLRRYIDDRVG